MKARREKKNGRKPAPNAIVPASAYDYGRLIADISDLLERARRGAARAVNSVLTATYWEIGRRIVLYEQRGLSRAEYGDSLIRRLAQDLTTRHGRGFSMPGLYRMRGFYQGWRIFSTPSRKLEARAIYPDAPNEGRKQKPQTLPAESVEALATVPNQIEPALTDVFPLSWSHYVLLMTVDKPQARAFYESEAIRGGWSVRQLDRQVGTQFYERAVKSKRPAALLARGQRPQPQDLLSVEEEIRDPYLLEFLNLKDEYSETDLEEALVRHLEWFLLEMGTGFTFVARQKRIRVGDSWFRIDLLLFHRGLRCLVVVDLKPGAFTHANAGQMNLYLNYVREHLTIPGEADPVGIILCSSKDDAVVRYATGGIRTQVFASKYLTYLPDEETLRREILTTQRAIQARRKEIR